MTTMIVASVATGALATIARWLLTRRSVILREVGPETTPAAPARTAELGLSGAGPTVVHSGPQGVRPATGYAEGSATSAPIWEMLLTSRSTWTPTRRQRGDFRCFRCPPR